MMPFDVKPETYVNTPFEFNTKKPKLNVRGHLQISRYKRIFLIGYKQNCSEEVFVIKNVKDEALWKLWKTLSVMKLLQFFMYKNWKKQTNRSLGLKR